MSKKTQNWAVPLIGEKHGIDIQSTEGNSHLGDFSYPKEDEQKLIAILDSYLKD